MLQFKICQLTGTNYYQITDQNQRLISIKIPNRMECLRSYKLVTGLGQKNSQS